MNDNFLWGGSIAAHQTEGAYDKGGKGLAIMDLASQGSYEVPRRFTKTLETGVVYPSHTGIDFYHHYQEDIALFAEMGFTSLRLSVDWSRIYPNGDDPLPNQEGIDFYVKVVDELLKYNIEPIVTLYHFEMPINLVHAYGSWLNREVVQFYLKYCQTMLQALQGKVKYWITFNEMNHLDPKTEASDIFTYILAGLKYSELEKGNKHESLAIIGYHMTLASAMATKLIHKMDENNTVGCVFGITPVYPFNCNPTNVMMAFKEMERDYYQLDALCQGRFPAYKLKEYERVGIHLEISNTDQQAFAEGTIDFIGINYYMSSVSQNEENIVEEALFGGSQNPYLNKSEWGWAIDPTGLRYVLNYTYHKYGLPLLVTENGLGAVDQVTVDGKIHDTYRVEYLKQHLQALKQAIVEDYVECFGYLMWSPIDCVSATTGEMKKRYGCIYVDTHDDGTGTGVRKRKDSFYWYQQTIQENGRNL